MYPIRHLGLKRHFYPCFHTRDFYHSLFTAIMPVQVPVWHAAIWVLAKVLASSPVKQRCLHQRDLTRQWGQTRDLFFKHFKTDATMWTSSCYVLVSLLTGGLGFQTFFRSCQWLSWHCLKLKIPFLFLVALGKTTCLYKTVQCAVHPQQAVLILHLWII